MFPWTAYLRVYEPLSAFPEAEGRRWAAYAASADRPRRAEALAAEQAGALRRLVAVPPVAAPECESGDAYVRWARGVTYICPWQTRLRSWLTLAQLTRTSPMLLSAAFPAEQVAAAVGQFAHWQGGETSPRIYIQASAWSVPPEWFVPFAPDERWLVLGGAGDGGDGTRATASVTRTLVYSTSMAQARRRVARALGAIRRARGGPAAGPSTRGDRAPGHSPGRDAPVTGERPPGRGAGRALAGLEAVGCWLEEFHPHALVELDYGGLVHLLDNAALRADQSAAEVSAAVRALTAGEIEFATAMRRRLASRWQVLEVLAQAS